MTTTDDTDGGYGRRTVLGGLLAAGGLAGLSMLERPLTESAQAQQPTQRQPVTITASPATTASAATYTITVRDVAARDGQSNVDQVALDFRGTGMDFNTVDRADVTLVKNPATDPTPLVVTKTRTALAGEQPTIGISRASGQPPLTEGDTLRIVISGVENPASAAQYVVGVRLNELATGQRAGALDARTGAFTITDETGTITGTVTSDGEPVTGEVTVTDEDGTVLGVTTPDETGAYELEGILPDTYDVVASGPGFEETTVIGVDVSEGEETAAEIDLLPEETAIDVEAIDVPETVAVGDTIDADVTLTNDGIETGTETVTVDLVEADGDVADSVTVDVTLGPGESTTVETSFETDDLDPMEYGVRPSTEETVDAEYLTVVEEPDAIAVELTSVDSPRAVGQVVRATAVVSNNGQRMATQYADLSIGGQPVDSRTVTLGPGASSTVVYTASTTGLAAGAHDVQVQAGAASDSGRLELHEPPAVGIASVDAPPTVRRGDQVAIAVELTNTGDVVTTQSVSAVVQGRTVATRSVTLGPGTSRTVRLAWRTGTLRLGPYELTVVTENDEREVSLTIVR
ncbi:carboxypeptidase-like regulatory domain-containing protein [Natronobiforma cellulositropha]|uniref:carboxypeptidase-like regulatory domain-containing protein n=1 Tax=Natronobiforma cellulositropha TaxID=1679076 RepID=UPI0021D5A9ED|nr:carboxypeptidase-like regulatory domain-containing protein [Natronobiforma cellulositropha]